ncbi:MAG: hypothetical protein ACYC38_09960 [Eubacteriales bacterium]
MSKIKLLYDVITTMKDKESCSGKLKVEGSRDRVKIFGLENEFEKNMADGRTKAKVTLEMDCEGKKVKHESSTEFDGCGSHGTGRHGFMGHMISHCHGHHPDHGQMGTCGENKRCGVKEKLSRLVCLLGVLNSMKVKEQEDKSTVLSLDFAEIPGEMKKMIHEKLLKKKMQHEHGHQCVCKEFSGMEVSNGGLNIFINKNKEVEKVTLTIEGKQKGDLGDPRQMNLQAELRFAW